MNNLKVWLSFLPLVLSSSLISASPTSPIQQASDLLEQGDAQAAYTLLYQLEHTYSFNADYNYLLGVSALQTRHYSQARNAFERTLLLQPGNAGAYLDLAITEIELKNFHEARRLLQEIEQRFNPPEGIRQVINAYNARISSALTPRNYFSSHVFIGGGYSDNVNNGTDKSLIELDLGTGPVLLPVSNSSKSSPDSYSEAGATLSYNIEQGPWRHQLISAIQRSDYHSMTEFNTVNAVFGANSSISYEQSQIDAGIYYSTVWLDGADYQTSTSGSGQYSYQLPSGLKLASQLRLSQLRYIQTQSNNINRAELTFSASKAVSVLGKNSLLQATLRFNRGSALNNRAGGDEQQWQAGMALITQLNPQDLARLSLSVGNNNDSTPYNPSLLGPKVRDTQKLRLSASYSHQFNETWSITTGLNIARNRSNIDLFTTDSNELTVRLNYKLL